MIRKNYPLNEEHLSFMEIFTIHSKSYSTVLKKFYDFKGNPYTKGYSFDDYYRIIPNTFSYKYNTYKLPRNKLANCNSKLKNCQPLNDIPMTAIVSDLFFYFKPYKSNYY